MDWTRTTAQVARLLHSQTGLNSSFAWQGRTIDGVRTTLRREDVAMDAGLAGDYTFSLLCSSTDFAGVELPRPRLDKITVDNRVMRVLAVERDSVEATIRLHLGDVIE